MRSRLLAFLLPLALLAQNTAKFPNTRVATNADFGIATNRAASTLTAGITSSTTNIQVMSSSQFKAGSFATIDSEIIAICSIPDGTHVQVGVSACPNTDGRGIDTANGGGAAASHLSGAVIQGRITAWHVNQSAAEIEAIEKALFGKTINVKNYGAAGDGSTDDTTAISNAITASLSGTYSFPPCVLFPQGTYKLTSTIQISARNVCLEGVTPWSTTINASLGSSSPIFNLDTFSTTTAPPWTGVANGFTVRNLTIENSAEANVSNTGSRGTIGIQSNGSGHITMENVQFSGLKFGFAAPYGSDFDRFRNIWLASNDVGIYMGPASEQFEILGSEGHTNGEGIVCDGCWQGSIHDNHIVDSMTADVTFERSQPTRSPFSWNPASISSYDPYSEVTVADNWFETGAGYGGITAWQEYTRILVKNPAGSFSSYPRHITIRDNMWVAGSTGIAAKDGNKHSFLELDSGKFITLNNVDIVGDRRDATIYGNGGVSVSAQNFKVEDGYDSTIPLFAFASGTYLTNDFEYTYPFNNIGATSSIPTTCYSGAQFWYDSTLSNWLACIGTGGTGGLGTFSYLAQLDNTLHIPNSINTLAPSWSSWTVNGDKTTLNAVQATVYSGNSGSNNGKWWFQNGGSPVDHLSLAGYDSSGNQNLLFNPGGGISGGATSIGSMKFGFLVPTGVTFANLGTPSDGMILYCSDCTNKLTDSHTVGNACAGSGHGALAMRQNGNWVCF